LENIFIKKIITQSSFGYAYHKIILDDAGNPSDYQFIEVNPAFEHLTGLKSEYILNKKITEILPGILKDTFDWIQFYGHIALNNGSKEFEQYSESLKKWYRVQACSPEKYYFVTLFFDITDHKLAETTLRQSEAKFRQYIDNAPDGIFIVDMVGHYQEVNPAACKMLGYTADELLNMSIPDIVPPESLDLALAAFNSLLKNGSDTRDIFLLTKDGKRFPVTLDAVSLPGGRYMGFCKDITERKQAEKEKELYFSAIQSLDQPVIITDNQGVILEINRAFFDMYGYTTEEVIGKDPKILNPGKQVYQNLGYTEEEYNHLFKDLWQSIKDPQIGTWQNNIINRKKDGSLVWVKLLINAIYNTRHEIKHFIGLPIDISNSRQIEKLSKIELYQTIADLAELRDSEIGNHMRRVGIFAKLIAKALHQSEKYCDDIELFAPMHDIGKVGILDSILLAARKLTVAEFNEMKNHTILGYNIVKGKKELDMVAAITLNHHERYDGTGYPNGIKGENIPLSARITAIADVYDALRSKRPYKKPWTHEEAKNEILNNSGTQFDPRLVTLFMELHRAFETAYAELED
jgi:PAS domain S-box-containing protein